MAQTGAVPVRERASSRRVPVWKQLCMSGLATGVATCVTHPIDTCKSRIQLHGVRARSSGNATAGSAAPGLRRTAIDIVQREGVAGLFSGLPAALLRVCAYSSTRIGLYEPFKDGLSDMVWYNEPKPTQQVSLGVKLGAGLLSGGCAAIVGNPLELTKVRMQSKDYKRYRNVFDGVYRIAIEEGVPSLWRGIGPAIVRSSLLTATQLVTYEESKRMVTKVISISPDSSLAHVTAGMLSGIVTTTVVNPADVVKTLLMNSNKPNESVRASCLRVLRDGLLWRGWTANYVRLGPHILITFVVYERVRELFGVQPV